MNISEEGDHDLNDISTICAEDIQKRLGLSKNQVKTIMKKHRVEHDGTEKMLYPLYESEEVIRKEMDKSEARKKKRQAISENRKNRKQEKSNHNKGKFISNQDFEKALDLNTNDVNKVKKEFGLTENPLSVQTMETFLSADGKNRVAEYLEKIEKARIEKKNKDKAKYITQAEICDTLNIDRYEIKSAIHAGLLTPYGGHKRFLRDDIDNLDVDSFKEKLVWEKQYPTTNAAKLLGVSNAVFMRFTEKHNIEPVDAYKSANYNVHVKLWRYGDFAFLLDSEELAESLARSSKIKAKKDEEENQYRDFCETEQKRVAGNVRVGIRDRSAYPEYIALHLGPTNSGKTYNALENLCEEYTKNPDGIFVYAGPLRMLAYEVYQKLAERFGEEFVGFITGEEQINPEAPILATTVEMAPREGNLLIVDEAHWIVDDNRGHYWTELMLGGKYNRIHVIAAAEVKENILPLVEDAWQVETFEYERRTPLTYGGMIQLKDIAPKTAVVCFSRKSVYAMASALQSVGKKVGVLYGALPLYARKKQIDDFIAGNFDIIVTTDVIGHGINLPIDNVVFAETDKFDGKIRRNLHTWETAQIAGRAGRYGISEQGQVYIAAGRKWFTQDAMLVRRGTGVAMGHNTSDIQIDKPLVSPKFDDLGLGENDQVNMNYSLEIWQSMATELLQDRNVKPSELEVVRNNLSAVAEELDCYVNLDDKGKTFCDMMGKPYKMKRDGTWKLPTEQLWQLVSGPFDKNSPVLIATALWLNQGGRKDSSLLYDCFSDFVASAYEDDLEMLEKAARINSELQMVALMFADNSGNLGNFNTKILDKMETVLNENIVKCLKNAVASREYGTCLSCGDECMPWFKFCDGCFHSGW